jgi:hypothetical protein
MPTRPHPPATTIEDTITARTGVGPTDMVRGWQSMLSALLEKMTPYLQPGALVTFQQLTAREQSVFQDAAAAVAVPSRVYGLYLPPSVRNQMMYTNRGEPVPSAAANPADDGALLFNRSGGDATIVNVLLAHPPHAPAMDVYQGGAMTAGYVFANVPECLAAVSGVLRTFLVPPESS